MNVSPHFAKAKQSYSDASEHENTAPCDEPSGRSCWHAMLRGSHLRRLFFNQGAHDLLAAVMRTLRRCPEAPNRPPPSIIAASIALPQEEALVVPVSPPSNLDLCKTGKLGLFSFAFCGSPYLGGAAAHAGSLDGLSTAPTPAGKAPNRCSPPPSWRLRRRVACA